jgi:hypothetical protein
MQLGSTEEGLMPQENKKSTSPRGRDAEAGKFIPNDQSRKRPTNPSSGERELPEQNRKLGKHHD